MRRLRLRPTGGVSWITRMIRAAVVCTMMLSMADAAPLVTLMSVQQKPKCGDACPRCLCKRHSVPSGMRAPCPCCSSRQPGMSGLSPLPPAVMPDLTREIRPLSVGDLTYDLTARVPTYAPAVPHPPPRDLFFS